MAPHSLGLDFGTESVRALLLDLETGRETAAAEFGYPSGVISERLPGQPGTELGRDWFLQDPDDYLTGLHTVVPAVLDAAGLEGREVVGVGLDFTACTLMACDAHGQPLCSQAEFRGNPHAWVKLWKHHGAAAEAERVQEVAQERNEEFLRYYAGTISSEWLIPKALETLRAAPDVYAAATFVEAADWLVWQLTGRLVRNACCAGYKAQYVHGLGWPSPEFLSAVDPGLAGLFTEKVRGPVVPPGTPVGGLKDEWAQRIGLKAGTPVAAPVIDAHAAVPGCGVASAGRMVMVLGTSFCHMLLGEELRLFEGVAGVVRDGILPGYYGYESGQTAGGDIYGWCVDNFVPASYAEEARRRGVGLHELLTEKAAKLAPGQSGLLALDWWNGNRSVLMDAQLSGLLVGLTLDTRPEDVYRACIEGTMFGARRIVDAYRNGGVPIDGFVACGGLPYRNPLAMQILADILNHPVQVAGSRQTPALGAAMLGGVAAGLAAGGPASIQDAARSLVPESQTEYRPSAAAARVYDELYQEYLRLHDRFGRDERLMHRLKALQTRLGTG